MNRTVATRGIAAGVVIVIAAAVAVAVTRGGGEDPSVLGSKIERCVTDDGTVTVEAGAHGVTADNAPLTVTVANGRITSVLAPAVRIEPTTETAVRLTSFTLGRPTINGDMLDVVATMTNLSDCTLGVGRTRASIARKGGPAIDTPVRFGGDDEAVVGPRDRTSGTVSVPLEGDGTYEVTATAAVEFGRVR